MMMKTRLNLTILLMMLMLTLASPYSFASDINTNTGAGASIPSSSQQNYDYNKFAISSSLSSDEKADISAPTRVQEDPEAGSRVLPREKPVSYFKRDARLGTLPKR